MLPEVTGSFGHDSQCAYLPALVTSFFLFVSYPLNMIVRLFPRRCDSFSQDARTTTHTSAQSDITIPFALSIPGVNLGSRQLLSDTGSAWTPVSSGSLTRGECLCRFTFLVQFDSACSPRDFPGDRARRWRNRRATHQATRALRRL